MTLFGAVFLPLLLAVVLLARPWLPALLLVATTLQAASVVNVDLAAWLPASGLGVYGITPYNAVALCMGVLLLWRGVTVGWVLPLQVRRSAGLWLVLSAVLVATLWAAQSTRYSQDIDKTLNELLLNKAQPGNQEERALTNVRAMEIVGETHGLGVGLGSNRASSFFASLLSNTGVPGAVLFAAMLVSLLWRYFRTPQLSDPQLFVGVSLFTATIAV